MASWSISDDKQKELLELAQAWGKVVARRACETQSPGLDAHVTPMEDVAFLVGQALSQGVLEALLEQHAQQLAAAIPCPDCQAPCPVKREPRVLHLRGGGVITYNEPVCDCSSCRRAFFPLATSARPGQS